jgi:hypothetical protein
VRAAFYRPDDPDTVIGSAVWRANDIDVEAEDETARQVIWRIFRPTPVVIDDPSLRSYGTAGPVMLPPGSLSWFRSAAGTRSAAEGVGVRFISEAEGAMGWDPAGAYRTFNDAIERMERLGSPPGTEPTQQREAVTRAAAQG